MITPIGAVTVILSPLKILAAAIFEPPSDTEVSDDVVKSYTLYSNVLLLISTLVIIGEVIDDDKVLIETGIGGVRILETPIADPVPRVC